MERFRREAEVASKLDHPGICAVYDTGVEKGVPYIAMRLRPRDDARGEDRGAIGRPRRSVRESTPRDRSRDRRVIEKTARALHAAHEAGVIHRDIKPGNVMVSADGQPVILDFGLASDEDGDLQTLTQSGDLFGTPAYMSPEQLMAQTVRLDRRTDVYSLGVTLFECLALRQPFEAPTREAMYQAIQYKEPPDVRKLNPHVPKDLKVVIETALQKDRDKRYATAAAFAEDLRQGPRASEPITAKPVGPIGRTVRFVQRRPARAALIAALAFAVPAIAILATSYVKDRPQVEAARRMQLEEQRDDLLSEASILVADGDYQAALGVYEKAALIEGGSPEAIAGIVTAQLKLKQPESALRSLDANEALVGKGTAGALLRADALRALAKVREAEDLERRAPEPRDSFDFAVLARRDRDAAKGGESAAASRSLEHATRAILNAPRPRLLQFVQRAEAAGVAGDRTAATDTALALKAKWPHAAVARYWAGHALHVGVGLDAIEEAIADYREAIRIGFRSESHVGHEAHHNLAVALDIARRFDEAVAEYGEAIRLDPGCRGARRSLANTLIKKDCQSEAIAACREGLGLWPDDLELQRTLGRALEVCGLDDEAIAAYEACIRLHPGDWEALNNLGAVLCKNERIREAIPHLRKAVELNGQSAPARLNLGIALIRSDALDEGIAQLRASIGIDALKPKAHFFLASALSRQGHADESFQELQESARLGPDDASIRFSVGTAFGARGRHAESISELREALRLDGTLLEARERLGRALLDIGLVAEAVEELGRIIATNPDRGFAHCCLGFALTAQGRFEEGRGAIVRGEGLRKTGAPWTDRTDGMLEQAEAFVRCEPELARRLADGSAPSRNAFLLAMMALAKDRSVVSARWFRGALSSPPALPDEYVAHQRLNAVRAAVRASFAGSDGGQPLGDPDRAAWRAQALDWLRDEMRALREPDSGPELRTTLRMLLCVAKCHVDLAPVRGEAIEELPAGERGEWRSLWKTVDEALAPR